MTRRMFLSLVSSAGLWSLAAAGDIEASTALSEWNRLSDQVDSLHQELRYTTDHIRAEIIRGPLMKEGRAVPLLKLIAPSSIIHTDLWPPNEIPHEVTLPIEEAKALAAWILTL